MRIFSFQGPEYVEKFYGQILLGNRCCAHFIAEETETVSRWGWMKVSHLLSQGQTQKQKCYIPGTLPRLGHLTSVCTAVKEDIQEF